MGAEEAWEQIHPQLFTYIHFFSGPVPERFEGIHEALDFFPRIGGANGAELTALKAMMGNELGKDYHINKWPCAVCDKSPKVGHP